MGLISDSGFGGGGGGYGMTVEIIGGCENGWKNSIMLIKLVVNRKLIFLML
jgi:hypothetical protein